MATQKLPQGATDAGYWSKREFESPMINLVVGGGSERPALDGASGPWTPDSPAVTHACSARVIPSREREWATRSHRLQRARNTRLITLALDCHSTEALNLVFKLQKRLAKMVARCRSQFGMKSRSQKTQLLSSRPGRSWDGPSALEADARETRLVRTFKPLRLYGNEAGRQACYHATDGYRCPGAVQL